MVKKLLSILAALGMSATATSMVVACGQASTDLIRGGKIPLWNNNGAVLKVYKGQSFDFAQYIHLSKTDPAAYARIRIEPISGQFQYTLDTDNGHYREEWKNIEAGISYTNVDGDWTFYAEDAKESTFISLKLTTPGFDYEPTMITINVLLSPADEVRTNVELQDYLIPKTVVNQWYQKFDAEVATDTLIVHAWAKIGDETIVFTPDYGAEPDEDLIATWFQKNKELLFSFDEIESVTVHFEVLDQKPNQKAVKVATYEVVVDLDPANIK